MIWWYLGGINILAYLIYAIDKWKAAHGKWRISENALLLLGIAGGSIGAYWAMQMFHHKIRKPQFYIGIPVTFVIWAAGIAVWIWMT